MNLIIFKRIFSLALNKSSHLQFYVFCYYQKGFYL